MPLGTMGGTLWDVDQLVGFCDIWVHTWNVETQALEFQGLVVRAAAGCLIVQVYEWKDAELPLQLITLAPEEMQDQYRVTMYASKDDMKRAKMRYDALEGK